MSHLGEIYPANVHEWWSRSVSGFSEIRRYVGGDGLDVWLTNRAGFWQIVAKVANKETIFDLDDPECFNKLRRWWVDYSI